MSFKTYGRALPERRYRVWTKDCNFRRSVLTDWMTYSQCKKCIIGRWGHWPPFAVISEARDDATFVYYHGE